MPVNTKCILTLGFILFHVAWIQADNFESTLGVLRTRTRPEVQERAVLGLMVRLLGHYQAGKFHISVDPGIIQEGKDVFKLKKTDKDEKVRIVGSSGVSVAWGLHYYLKYKCKCHISWDGDQLNLPHPFPEVDITVIANDRLRYYQNVCTWSYSFVWWDWDRWERELDWMALNGINLALAFNGQEAVWNKVYLDLGLTQDQVDEHFTGPAFLAWGRMGNMRGWGGPLSRSWHQRSLDLQNKTLQRMRELGITPVLPAFSGQVPRAFQSIFPKANLTKISDWNSFPDMYCCPYLLSPEDPLFSKVGTLFLESYIKMYGTDHVYSCDTFNEIKPPSGDLGYIKSLGQSIYSAMANVDPKAVWMLQGWFLVNDESFWTLPRAKSFLTSVPPGKMLVLDLQSELHPQFGKLDSYFGQPFIWCMLHNFGGTLGLHGSAEVINKEVFAARSLPNSTMVGTGITPEGIEQNYVIYDLMLEMSWRKEPSNLLEWFDQYAERRYGVANGHTSMAWQYLKKSVYNYTGSVPNHGKYIVVRSPRLNLTPNIWYNSEDVLKAWDEMVLASQNMKNPKTTFLYDLVDITRQSLQVLIDGLYTDAISAYNKKLIPAFTVSTMKFMYGMTHLESILASDERFLLGNWIESAKKIGTSPLEKMLLERNARNQITLWGPNGEILDYGNKQWSGLFKDYYNPRWLIFWSAMMDSLMDGTEFNETATKNKIYKSVEQAFTYRTDIYPVRIIGDSINISNELHRLWRVPHVMRVE